MIFLGIKYEPLSDPLPCPPLAPSLEFVSGSPGCTPQQKHRYIIPSGVLAHHFWNVQISHFVHKLNILCDVCCQIRALPPCDIIVSRSKARKMLARLRAIQEAVGELLVHLLEINTSYAMLSSGIPWNMPCITCILRIHTIV